MSWSGNPFGHKDSTRLHSLLLESASFLQMSNKLGRGHGKAQGTCANVVVSPPGLSILRAAWSHDRSRGAHNPITIKNHMSITQHPALALPDQPAWRPIPSAAPAWRCRMTDPAATEMPSHSEMIHDTRAAPTKAAPDSNPGA